MKKNNSKKTNDNEKKKKRNSKKRKLNGKLITIIVSSSLAILFFVIFFVVTKKKSTINTVEQPQEQSAETLKRISNVVSDFEHKVELLHNYIFKLPIEKTILTDLTQCKSPKVPFVVFFSISDKRSRAMVVSGDGDTLQTAWNNALSNARKFVKSEIYQTVWLKVDIVNRFERIKTSLISNLVKKVLYHEFFRQGIAFDESFTQAFLEAEINGNKLIDYSHTKNLDLKQINSYLEKFKRPLLKKIPSIVILFTCRGYICDGTGCHTLNFQPDLNYGRREIENVDGEYIRGLISTASDYLANSVLESGQFIYGYFPTYDKKFTKYNILRHASTIWSLIYQYKTTRNEKLVPKIDSTIKYLLKEIVYNGEDTAYLVEKKSSEIKLGGNSVVVIALTDYMEVFETLKYVSMVKALGNGILTMLDHDTGEYFHTLYYDFRGKKDFSRKDRNRTVYYDGEATFALSRIYGLDKNEKWLTAAKSAVGHFIKSNYVQYRDHWVAYSLNEITKYAPDEAYYTFALRNANDNLNVFYNQETTYHTYLELLMITFELYDRMMKNNIEIPYLNHFNATYFIDTIFHRADHMLNGYFYPEYAMYMKNPSRIVNTFFVRHDGYRVRIDDVQHFVGGYYYYCLYYDKLVQYRENLKSATKKKKNAELL